MGNKHTQKHSNKKNPYIYYKNSWGNSIYFLYHFCSCPPLF